MFLTEDCEETSFLQGVFDMQTCGVAYWLITVAQIPIAVAFTACIVHQKRKLQTENCQVVELVRYGKL
jgi:hypothetical protein